MAERTRSVHAAGMEVPITQFRRDIFALANRVLEGETITVAYKGKRIQVTTAPTRSDPFARLEGSQPLQIVNPNYPDLDDSELKAEMQKEMEADWAEIESRGRARERVCQLAS